MNIYVANLSFNIHDEELRNLFSSFGDVTSAKVIMDKYTNRSKGFGFVEMADEKSGEKAIAELHGSMVEGRPLTVNRARPKNDRW